MSRLLKRVPFDFKWQMHKVWEGYILPEDCRSTHCECCDGSGLNPETKKINDSFHGDCWDEIGWCNKITQDEVEELVAHDKLWTFTRRPITEEQKKECEASGKFYLDHDNGHMPTAEEVNELNSKPSLLGHDGISQFILVKTRAKRLGVWGYCPRCNGEGYYFLNDEVKQKHDAWERYEPPIGEGYQLWENCSEGSPISPVFNSLWDLCMWAEKNATTFGRNKTSAQHWMEMLEDDFVYHKDESGNMFA